LKTQVAAAVAAVVEVTAVVAVVVEVAAVVTAVVEVAAVDDEDGVQWRRWGGGVQWQRHGLTVASMDYG
jgi:hypothetical protein